jgi:hypothetical protein
MASKKKVVRKKTPRKKAGASRGERKKPVPPKEHQFKPGQSGNPKGKPKGVKSLTKALRDAVADGQTITLKVNGKSVKVGTMDALIQAAVRKAVGGDFNFWKEILNRVDGAVTQGVSLEPGGDSSIPLADLAMLLPEEFRAEFLLGYRRLLKEKYGEDRFPELVGDDEK